MNKLPNKFRPSSSMDTKNIMKMRRIYGRTDNYNWQSRVEWYPVGFKLNHKTISNQMIRLHYLACHAPEPVTKRWTKANKNFMNKHFGDAGKATMRYLNKWSCHSWL
jgi:hypothetical protein